MAVASGFRPPLANIEGVRPQVLATGILYPFVVRVSRVCASEKAEVFMPKGRKEKSELSKKEV